MSGPSAAQAASQPFIEIKNLTKVYRTRAGDTVGLNDVSLSISEGEFAVLLGPSGCGKTTLLRCLAGLERPQEGTISINGHIVFSSSENIWVPAEARGLSMVFQSYALWPHFNVFENVAFPLRTARVAKPEVNRRVDAVLEKVGLSQYAQSYAGQLSGGQQQRVALARAIVSESPVVLFDEPLSNLDAKVREMLRAELSELQKTLGFSAVFVTHDQEEAMVLADRIVVMDKGSVAQIGSPRQVYGGPESRYVADFVGRANELGGTAQSVADGRVTVATATGTVLATDPTGSLVAGDAVALLFRPQHCVRGDAENVFSGVVQGSTLIGSHVDVQVALGDRRVVLVQNDENVPPVGSTLQFGIPAAHVWAFRADRGGRA